VLALQFPCAHCRPACAAGFAVSQDLRFLHDSFPHVPALELCAPVLDLQVAIRRLRSLPDLPLDPLLGASTPPRALGEGQEGAQAGAEEEAAVGGQGGTMEGFLQTGGRGWRRRRRARALRAGAARQRAGLKDMTKVRTGVRCTLDDNSMW